MGELVWLKAIAGELRLNKTRCYLQRKNFRRQDATVTGDHTVSFTVPDFYEADGTYFVLLQ